MMKNPAYWSWQNMRQRCTNPNATGYHRYGGRGITVCERWERSFEAFLSDMGPRPEGFTIERCDNNGNYEPGNCKWASRRAQSRNVRRNLVCEIAGIEYLAADLADRSAYKAGSIFKRAKSG